MDINLEHQVNDLPLWSDTDSHQVLKNVAQEHGISLTALAKLLVWERERQERLTRLGITEVFDKIFDNDSYWRSK